MFTENFSILDDEKNNDKEKVSLSHAEFSEDTCNLMKKAKFCSSRFTGDLPLESLTFSC